MSTRTKESVPSAKEKGGTSPSQTVKAGATQRRRSPIPSKTTSLDSSGRNIPSYLKPTASSITDVSKQHGKKPVSTFTDTATKPNLARRRSFDKPPSPQKSPISLNPAVRSSSFTGKNTNDSANKPAVARRRSFDKPPSPSRTQKSPFSPNPALRSSSLPGKVDTSQKGTKEGGKQHTLYARPVSAAKKSSVLAKRNAPVSGSSRKGGVATSPGEVEKLNIHDVPEPEPQSDDQESSNVEKRTIDKDYIDKESKDSVMEDQQVANIIEISEGDAEVVPIESPIVLEQKHDANIVRTVESPTNIEQCDANVVTVESPMITENQDEKVVIVEDSTVLEHQDASLGVDVEKVEDESLLEEISIQNNANEVTHSDTNESVEGNPDREVEDTETEEEGKEKEEIGLVNKEEEVDGERECHELMGTEVQEVVAEERNEEEDATPRVAHGKKDLALSNDVIEETKIKLIEQRKNKVKALAGAFETVISLQE